MKLLFVGDVVGKPGRKALGLLEKVIAREAIDFTVVNVENAAGGFGVTVEIFADLSKLPIDVFTSGNHIWDKKDFVPLLDDIPNLIRPANYPPGNPGRGWSIQSTPAGIPVGVLNLQGQVFMAATDSPLPIRSSCSTNQWRTTSGMSARSRLATITLASDSRSASAPGRAA